MKIKKILCAILSATLLASSAIPVLAVENTDSTQDAPVLTEGAYAPNQAVVLFRDSAIDTSSALKKGDLESVGANFGEMPDASSSENESLSAADEEVNILKSTLGDDFVLEDTLVFDNDGTQSKAGDSVGAAKESSEEFTVALVSSDKYDTAALIEKLNRNKNIEKTEPNFYIHQTSLTDYSLNDPLNRYLYDVNSPAAKNNGGEHVDSQGVDPAAAMSVNASSGWAKAADTEKEAVVAVIDSGVMYTHEDLKDRMWTNPGNIGLKGTYGYDFINNDDPLDDNNHGTHCSGIITAQANNAKGVAGIASAANVKIMALKIFGSSGNSETQTTFFNVFGAYHYIHKAVQGGVNVVAVNNSWRGHNYSTIYDKLLDLVGEEGVISYLAAFNDGANNERTRTYPANSKSEFAVSVGAADIEGSRAIFSDYGKTSVDVFGPGVSVLSSVASDVYVPGLYDAEKLNATTEYYGEFGADVKEVDGSVTPSTGTRAGDEIKSFGSLKFVKQRSHPEDDDIEIPDDAALELSPSKTAVLSSPSKTLTAANTTMFTFLMKRTR